VANEFSPRLDFRGDAAFIVRPQRSFGDLFRQRLNKELSALGVVQQWKTKVYRVPVRAKRQSAIASANQTINSPPRNVILIQSVLAPGFGKVDYALYIVLIEDLAELALILSREEYPLARHVWNRVQKLLDLG
jgi:hypothetical protein